VYAARNADVTGQTRGTRRFFCLGTAVAAPICRQGAFVVFAVCEHFTWREPLSPTALHDLRLPRPFIVPDCMVSKGLTSKSGCRSLAAYLCTLISSATQAVTEP